MTTLRIVRHAAYLPRGSEVDGEYFCSPDDVKQLARAQKTLADCVAEEPNMGWHLETRGTERDWHDGGK